MGRARIIVLAICVATAMAWLSQQSMAISIEREQPVRVTNRNSGPRYQLEGDVEKAATTATTDDNSNSNNNNNNNNNNQDDKRNSIEQPASGDDAPTPIGHMSIRRIFLVPMMSGPRPDWQSVFSSSNEQPQDRQQPQDNSRQSDVGDNTEQQQPGLLTRPFWPFLTPPIRSPAHHQHQHPHLFGADESSRPSPTANDREREGDSMLSSGSINNNNPDQPGLDRAGTRQLFDPIQMMLDMMHAALAPPENPLHDLANEANSLPRPDVDGGDNSGGDKPSLVTDLIRRPIKPESNNETKEDVVEIDGKKFLRKVVINRHVGENMVFVTRRLIFTPLNETATDSATTTTIAPNTNGPVASDQENAATNKPEVMSIDKVDKPARDVPGDDEPTTTTTTTTTTTAAAAAATSDQPSTTTAAPTTTVATAKEEPTIILASSPITTTTTTSAQPEDTTTTKADNSWVKRVSDAIEKAAERMVDDAEAKLSTITSTTDKPASTESLV